MALGGILVILPDCLWSPNDGLKIAYTNNVMVKTLLEDRARLEATFTRFYTAPPEEKTLEDCRNHGRDHRAYNHAKQLDPRWSDEQFLAYMEGFNG